ncbi:pro-opiomelanocortin-like [Stigmatopora argus]
MCVSLADNIKSVLMPEETRTQQSSENESMTDERMCRAWLLVTVVLFGLARGVVSQCWEHVACQELDSSSMMECLQLCHAELSDPTFNGAPLPPPLLPDSDSSAPAKRSYSMEHFRWGKPVGRKRRPIKVYTSNGAEEESSEFFPGEMKRDMTNELPAGAEEDAGVEEGLQKKDGSYKMKHFRWSSPPASKRYGGFMKSWDENKQKHLVTLLKNVINKDGQTQK